MSQWRPFDPADADPEPLLQFARWFDEAEGQMPDREAVCVSSATPGGRPSSRMVLLRHRDAASIGWYTNYDSRKGRELSTNSFAAVLWYCEGLGRQVRFEGPVERMSEDRSDAYFAARPRGHQLGAHASAQSSRIDSREDLEEAVSALAQRFSGREVPRPKDWGGYLLLPHTVEFFQQREDRLHDRVLYSHVEGAWSRSRLSP